MLRTTLDKLALVGAIKVDPQVILQRLPDEWGLRHTFLDYLVEVVLQSWGNQVMRVVKTVRKIKRMMKIEVIGMVTVWCRHASWC